MTDAVLPEFYQPETKEAAYELAERLTGDYWPQFSPPRPSPAAPLGAVGGQAFLAKRIKGDEWKITQPLCWLCGQGVLSPTELINALGRRLVIHSTDYEEQIRTPNDADPTPQVLAKTSAYGFVTWPLKKYKKEKGVRPYDKKLPKVSSTPYVYVIEDIQGDVKVGISNDPQRRFRDLERDEGTTLNPERCYCTEATRYALTIEQAVLNQFGKGRNGRKKSEEWLWEVTFEEAKAAIEKNFFRGNKFTSI